MFSWLYYGTLLVFVLLKCDDSSAKFYKESNGPREGYEGFYCEIDDSWVSGG